MRAAQVDVKLVACVAADEGRGVYRGLGTLVERHEHARVDRGEGRRLLDGTHLQAGVMPGDYLDDTRRQIAAGALLSMVAQQQAQLGVIVDHDEQTAESGHLDRSREYLDKLQGLLGTAPLGDVDEDTILGKERVEGHRRVGEGSQRAIIFLDKPGHLAGRAGQRHECHTLGQTRLKPRRGDEGIVGQDGGEGRQVGHVATERGRNVDRDIDARDVDPVVGSKHLLDRGLLVSLGLARGELGALQGRERLGAQTVERGGRVGVHRGRVVLVELDVLGQSVILHGVTCFPPLSSHIPSPRARGPAPGHPS